MAIRLEVQTDREDSFKTQRTHRFRLVLISIGTTFAVLLSILALPSFWTLKRSVPEVCLANSVRPSYSPDPFRINERHVLFPDQNDTLLTNATLIDGDGITYENANILIHKSTIVSVSTSRLPPLPNRENVTDIINLNGKYVTPGLVDMHSHFGTRVQPQLKGTEDTNEYTSPITPFVRAIDGIDSQDPELTSIAAAGVTTHLVLTGSKNLISGESYAIKMHKSPHNLVEELLVQYGVETDSTNKPMRWFKMAYGENEKQTGLPGYPVSRIGAIWRIREAFSAAKNLLVKQDTWCSQPHNWDKPGTYPTDIHLDTLVDILRDDVNVHIHLYEAYDFEANIRVAEEFGYHVAAFHHALSSYKVPELIKSHNSTVAIFADEWGSKKEQYDSTVHAARILEESGIPVALKTDHPALPGQQLLYYAQIAHHFGLKGAIESVTSIPANSIGLGHRIGYVRAGYDADLVVWDRHPMTLGVIALETFVDGAPLLGLKKITNKLVVNQVGPLIWEEKHPEVCESIKGSKNLVIEGITNAAVPGFVVSASKGKPLTAVVCGGEVVCVGEKETCLKELNGDYNTISVVDGYLVPGVTTTSEGFGLREMVLEDSTSDGDVTDGGAVLAADGLKLDGLTFEKMNRVGITQGVAIPIGSTFHKGISAHFRLSTPGSLETSLMKKEVADHFVIGNRAKSPAFPTISSQIGELRKYLSLKKDSLPIAIHTHNAGVMEQIIRLRNEFPDVSFVIIGAQEAHLIADQLAAAEISLILSPWRCTAKFWDNRHCSNGWPLETPSVDILSKAGVQFSVAHEDVSNLRRVFWEAGEASKAISEEGLPLEESLKIVSGNLEKSLGLGTNNDILVFEHNPFEFGATLALTVENGEVNRCYPDPEEMVHGDMLF